MSLRNKFQVSLSTICSISGACEGVRGGRGQCPALRPRRDGVHHTHQRLARRRHSKGKASGCGSLGTLGADDGEQLGITF